MTPRKDEGHHAWNLAERSETYCFGALRQADTQTLSHWPVTDSSRDGEHEAQSGGRPRHRGREVRILLSSG